MSPEVSLSPFPQHRLSCFCFCLSLSAQSRRMLSIVKSVDDPVHRVWTVNRIQTKDNGVR